MSQSIFPTVPPSLSPTCTLLTPAPPPPPPATASASLCSTAAASSEVSTTTEGRSPASTRAATSGSVTGVQPDRHGERGEGKAGGGERKGEEVGEGAKVVHGGKV